MTRYGESWAVIARSAVTGRAIFVVMSRKRKNIIDVEYTKSELESLGYSVSVMNDYQFRIRMPELTNDVYDWYHTSGTLVVNRENRSPSSTSVKVFDASSLHEAIFSIEEEAAYI